MAIRALDVPRWIDDIVAPVAPVAFPIALESRAWAVATAFSAICTDPADSSAAKSVTAALAARSALPALRLLEATGVAMAESAFVRVRTILAPASDVAANAFAVFRDADAPTLALTGAETGYSVTPEIKSATKIVMPSATAGNLLPIARALEAAA